MKVREIERRFLLKCMPLLHERKNFLRINQYYVTGENGVYRNRMTWNLDRLQTTYERIIKIPIDPGVNEEQHFPITGDEYNLEYQNKEKYISKIRHIFEHEGLKFEIDEFNIVKLIICEVELKTIDQPIIFPEYIKTKIIKEITGETEFSNYNLAI